MKPDDWDETEFGRWIEYLAESEDGSMSHPAHFLKCEKASQITSSGESTWVVTGWAPDARAGKRHAEAVGGLVRVTNNVLGTQELYCNP